MLEQLMYDEVMNTLNKTKRAQLISVLVEGNSLRATARICDVAFNTVLKFVPKIGQACAEYQDKAFHKLTCKRIQCDEIWSFCYAKQKNVPKYKRGIFGYGDVWTWVARDAETTRYRPGLCSWCKGTPITGNPEREHISTSFIERQNLSMRMGMRRFTRLTNAFSKKIENHAFHLVLHYMYYNFVRIHKTLRMTPAMKAGVTDHLWSVEEIAGLLK